MKKIKELKCVKLIVQKFNDFKKYLQKNRSYKIMETLRKYKKYIRNIDSNVLSVKKDIEKSKEDCSEATEAIKNDTKNISIKITDIEKSIAAIKKSVEKKAKDCSESEKIKEYIAAVSSCKVWVCCTTIRKQALLTYAYDRALDSLEKVKDTDELDGSIEVKKLQKNNVIQTTQSKHKDYKKTIAEIFEAYCQNITAK